MIQQTTLRLAAFFRSLINALREGVGSGFTSWDGAGRSMTVLHTKWRSRSGAAEKIKQLLTHKYLIGLALLLAVVLSLPALWRGWGFEDDIYHRAILLTSSLPEAMKSLFVFLDPSTTRAQMEIGVLPWWTLETTQIAFFRPLAVVTFWLDYQLWPDNSMLMHAHNLIWYLAVCAAAALLYRRIMGHHLASGLAILLFALNFPHVNAVYSIAARSQLIATFFGILALWAHDKSSRDDWKAGFLLGPVFLALSLFSAEAGIAIVGYLAAHVLFIDRGLWRNRLSRLIPYALVVVIWRLIYHSLGYGVWGSGFYLDPLSEPFRFALNIIEHAPILLLGQWVLPDPVLYAGLSTVGQIAFWLLAVAILIVLAMMMAPMFGKIRRARYWGLGMLLAVIPICGVSLASGRHLLILSIGAIALMAQFITGRFTENHRLLFSRRWKTFSFAVAILLLSLHALIYPIMASTIRWVADPTPAMMDLGPLPGVEGQDLIIVNSPSPGQSLYLLPLREVTEKPIPAHLRILAPAHSQIEVTRLDDQTVLIKPESGFLLPTEIDFTNDIKPFPLAHIAYTYRYGDAFFRENSLHMPLNGRVDLPGMQVEVSSLTPDSRPWEVRMVFARPLEDPSLKWLQWDWDLETYVPFNVPEIGQTVYVAGPF
ncbi:MAG: hypothetical protein WBB65_02755 [Anaerolineales bacterium]